MRDKTFLISRDVDIVNAIINSSDVRPKFGGDEYIDMTNVFAVGAFASLTPDMNGGAVIVPNGEGEGEVHIFAKYEAMGHPMKRACIDTAAYVLDDCECKRLYGYIDPTNRLALAFAKRTGFHVVGEKTLDVGAGMETLIEVERIAQCQ